MLRKVASSSRYSARDTCRTGKSKEKVGFQRVECTTGSECLRTTDPRQEGVAPANPQQAIAAMLLCATVKKARCRCGMVLEWSHLLIAADQPVTSNLNAKYSQQGAKKEVWQVLNHCRARRGQKHRAAVNQLPRVGAAAGRHWHGGILHAQLQRHVQTVACSMLASLILGFMWQHT